MKYDLVIAYRICPKMSKKSPDYVGTDKLAFSRKCLESFKNSLEGLNYKIYALLDNCPKEYEDLFVNLFGRESLEILHLEDYGNKRTFKKQIDILSGQDDAEIVYFAEDDYFYVENIKKMVDLLKLKKADFVTPYEHVSCYIDDHVISNRVTLFEEKRFVSVQHACLTFMTTKQNLIDNKRYFNIYVDWFGSDFVVWGCITLGFSFFKYLKLIVEPKNFSLINMKVYGSMVLYALHRFLVNKKYVLVMPIISLATHVERDFMAPGFDWKKIFEDSK